MNLVNIAEFPKLTTQDKPIFEAAMKDYFWGQIPFQRLQTALDVGSHIGIWSWLCQQHAPQMRITAIEPHIGNFMALRKNVKNITPVYGWCGYRKNAAGLCTRPRMSGSHYVIEHGQELPLHGRVIPLPKRYTLEDFGQIDLLKLDCEGSEFDILLNCADETLQSIQVIVGEYHLEHGNMSTLLNRLDYMVTVIPDTKAPHLGHFLAMRMP